METRGPWERFLEHPGPPRETLVPAGVPKTGQMSEVMAKVAAQNIAADLQRGERCSMPMTDMEAICILDV
jgi:sulfide:quinone oxidoreductase